MVNSPLLTLLRDPEHGTTLSEENWLSALETAQEARIESLIAERLVAVMPASVQEAVSERSTERTLDNIARCQTLLEVLDGLESPGIFTLAYKGPTLSELAHGSPTLRSFDDLDLWVAPQEYARAARCLQDLGYQHAVQPTPRCHLLQAFETTLVHPKRRVSIDLHRSFLPPATPLKDSALVEHLQDVEILGRSVRTLSNEALLVLLLAHGSKHAWRELRWAYDVHCLIERQKIDWSLVYELSLECGAHLACQVGLHLVKTLFENEVISELFWPGPLAEHLVKRSLDFLANDRPSLRELQLYHWSLCPTLYSKARYLFHTLVAPHELDLAWIDLPERLYWMYYLLRPVRKAGTLLRK